MTLSNWDKKAQATFAKILEVVPEPMREAMKPQLIAMIEGKAKGSPVTDAVIEKLVREDLPEPFMSQIMNLLAAGSGIDLSKADALLSRYKGKQEALLSLFHELQREYGYLPRAVLSKVSEQLSIPLSAVYRLATSYQAFSLEPKQKHVVKVCDGFACHLKDSDRVYDEFKKTADGRFTLEKVRCIGCCGHDPMVTIDGECGDSSWAQEKITQF